MLSRQNCFKYTFASSCTKPTSHSSESGRLRRCHASSTCWMPFLLINAPAKIARNFSGRLPGLKRSTSPPVAGKTAFLPETLGPEKSWLPFLIKQGEDQQDRIP